MEMKVDDKEKIEEPGYNDLIKIDLNKPEITKIHLLKSEKVPFKKDDKIIVYYEGDKKDKHIIKSPIYGWIYKYISDEKKILLEPCRHDTFYVNLCIKCGFKKTAQYDENQIKGYGFLTKDFFYSKSKAESIEKSVVNNYLEKKKLILLLDLDNTIIHTSSLAIPPNHLENLKNTYKNYFEKIPIQNEFGMINYIFVKFRPFLKTFLKNIKNKYEIFIYTLGTNEYASSIIQYINTNFEKDSLSKERMMCRVLDENGQAKNKSIKNVFPTQEKMVVIIDDHVEIWNESGENYICIHPYKFFLEKENNIKVNEDLSAKKKNINKQFYIKQEYDNVLFCMTNLLLSIHRKFYEFYSKFKIQKSIKIIANDYFLTIFNGKKFYYHLNYYKYPICNLKKIKKGKEPSEKKVGADGNISKANEDNKFSDDKSIKNKGKEEFGVCGDNTILKEGKKDSTETKIKEESISKENENKEIKEINDIKKGNNNNEIKIEENKEVKKPERNLEEEKNNFNILKNKIEKLGGKLILEEKDKFNAEIFLTDFYDENDDVIKSLEEYNKDKDKKIPIIHSHYIEICTMYLYQLNIEDFILSKDIKALKYLDLNHIFMKNKINIINFYGNKDFIDEN